MILFEAGRQGRKVRALWIGALIGALGTAGLTLVSMAQSLDAANAEAAQGRMQLALFFFGLFGLVAVAMSIYARCYVTRLAFVPGGALVSVETLGLVHDRIETLDPGSIDSTAFWEGGRGYVSAPWWTVRVRDRSLPLIVDAQGEVADVSRLMVVLSGGGAE